jgi:hypothetical protein
MSSLLSFEGEMSREIAASERKCEMTGWYGKLFLGEMGKREGKMKGMMLILGTSAAKRLT